MIKGIIFDWVETLSRGKRDLFPYSEKVLKELKKKYKLGLISLAGHGNKERIEDIKSTGIEHYFNSIIIATVKTPEMFLKCMNELGTTPKTTAVIDDRVDRGIQIGNHLGCPTYWVQKGKHSNKKPNKETGEPTYRINSIEDLLRLL